MGKRTTARLLRLSASGRFEDSRRALLFTLLPRMLQRDGTTPKFLQRAFGYRDQDRDGAPAAVVSTALRDRALATSRRPATRTGRDRKPRPL